MTLQIAICDVERNFSKPFIKKKKPSIIKKETNKNKKDQPY